MVFETPAVKEGNRLDVYVDSHMVEVYVNDGEYVVSNAVYGLRPGFHVTGGAEVELFALERG